MKPEVDLGAWIVAVYKVVSQYNVDDPALDPLEAIVTAGRAADLFSATRSLGKIDAAKFDTYRKLARLKSLPAKEILNQAHKLGFVDLGWSADHQEVTWFQFGTDSKEAVLEATGAIFSRLNPAPSARAVLQILQDTLVLPKNTDLITNSLVAEGIAESTARESIRLATELGLVNATRETEAGQSVIFNPHAFEQDATESIAVLRNLNAADRQNAQDILGHVRDHPGVPLPITLDRRILQILVKLGLLDFSKITTSAKSKGVYFPTVPHIWGVFRQTAGLGLSTDLIDDSKLLLNSLRYGEFYSRPGRGKIINPEWIINALLRDGAIGITRPATAIGEDYPLALSRGIVNVVESRIYPGRYSMELLKRDVAEAVSEVLVQRSILPSGSVPTDEEVQRAGQFISPSAVRVENQLPASLMACHDELIFGLRTMRRKP